MKLTENQTLLFVSLYREHVCLWDITSEFYKHKGMRQSALQKICEGMQIEGFTVEDVKNKIKSMRSTYYLELDKIKKSSTSGASGDVYQPKIKWFAEFNSFIRNSAPEPRKKKSRLTELSAIVKNMKEIKNDFSNSEREEDEFDIFGKYIATQLRKLSTEQAILGQEEIQKVVTKCRLNDLRFSNTSYSHILQAPGPSSNTFSMSPASTTDTQATDDSLNLLCEDTEYANIIMNAFNQA
ncbi:uncharacterized protein [Maniola hyperantus]|uniref:uncharacterized protein n=1 Tax=Aphantopus hyperantus TaxID=2795564 RepID=UPI00374A971B